VDPVESKLDQLATRLDEIARLLALLVARDKPLQDALADLRGVGFGPSRAADLLGTTPGYAKVALKRKAGRNR
jgi:hypothetical protein